jgi:hypothetical protein
MEEGESNAMDGWGKEEVIYRRMEEGRSAVSSCHLLFS